MKTQINYFIGQNGQHLNRVLHGPAKMSRAQIMRRIERDARSNGYTEGAAISYAATGCQTPSLSEPMQLGAESEVEG